MAETARKRFNISEKSSTKCRVGKTDFHTDCAKRALNIVGIDKQNTGLIWSVPQKVDKKEVIC